VQRFSHWFAGHTAHKHAGRNGRVILLNDMFSEYYEPALGRSAVELLEYWGYEVSLSPCFTSTRLSISLGLLDQARKAMASAVKWLQSRLQDNTWIIGLEPSELLTFRDEAGALLRQQTQREFLKNHQHRFILFEEFVSDHHESFAKEVSYKSQSVSLAVHVHCHQKSLSHWDQCLNALHQLPNAHIQHIPSGCCGMAGLFGYQQDTYDLSRQIGELVLFPFIRDLPPETRIVATGASCRQQIRDCLNIEAYHPAQILHQQLTEDQD
jgi:Fe-S oxidoreductase